MSTIVAEPVSEVTTAPVKAGPGKGHFSPIPLTFTGVDGKEHTYSGRGRKSRELLALESSKGLVAKRDKKTGAWEFVEGK